MHYYTFELYSSTFAQYSAYTAAGHTDHTPFLPIFGAHLVRTHRLDIMAGGAKVDKAPQKCRVDQWIMMVVAAAQTFSQSSLTSRPCQVARCFE
jgi:hypothetical protein